MKKTGILKFLLKSPVGTFKKGAQAQKEDYYKNLLRSEYNIEQLPTIDLLDLFGEFDEDLSTYSFLEGTSLITDIVLLKKLARSFENCDYLEIGSWRGESIVNIADVAKSCTSVTLSPEEMLSMGISKKFIAVHNAFSKHTKNITEVLHNSHTLDFKSLKQKYDLIFIDGDHSYAGVLNDTKKTYEIRKDINSVMVWHDYGFGPESVRPSVLKAMLDGIPKEKHKHLYHVSNTMCAVYIENRDFKTYFTDFPTYPNKKFSVSIKAAKFQ